MIQPQLNIVRLAHAQGLELPAYQTVGASGMDLRAAVADSIILKPLSRCLVPTGLIFEIPPHFEVQIRPRSGLALKNGVTCLNTPGTIDWDYRGEIKIIIINLGEENFIISRGLRIAQAVVAPVIQAKIVEINEVSGQTARGIGGFGSTGE